MLPQVYARFIQITLISIFVAVMPVSVVQAKALTLEVLEKIVIKQKKMTAFPVISNGLVLKQLNIFLSSNSRRNSIRDSFERWKKEKPKLEAYFLEFQVPFELGAVAIVESGFRRIPQKLGTNRPSGMWQFIPGTARRFGLRVNRKVDDRLNVRKQTQAAMKLFSAHYREFSDWNLAILAYNRGEQSVKKAMAKSGFKDSFELVEKEYKSHLDYLPRVMAVIILMANPELLEQEN